MTTERWLLAAYACSGLAGLIYEIAWTRLLSLHLGHTTVAVSTVTAAFMGGLGLGGVLGGRVASRLSRRRALWGYALLEFVVALAALSIAAGVTLLSPVFTWAYAEDGSNPLFSVARVVCAFALLLLPGLALGATFPMAVRVAVPAPTRPGGTTGRLYGANTVGAAVGALAAGFFLIPILGLTGTTITGMTASAVSIALALYIARRDLSDEAPADLVELPAKPRNARHKSSRQQRSRRVSMNVEGKHIGRGYELAATTLALTGFATFVYEVAWTRVLAMVVGPSIYAVATTLTSFITGIALGAFAGASLAERTRHPAIALAVTLVATATAACVSIAFVGSSDLIIWIGASEPAATFAAMPLPHLTIAVGLTLPIAVGLGVAFPLSLELAGGRDAIPARRLGILYAVNTTASVIGALIAGFVAIPFIGLRGCLLLATTSLLLGAAVLAARASTSRGRAVLVPLVAIVSWIAVSPSWDRDWMAAGGYLYTRFVPAGVERRAALTAGTLLYYREGATGTVSVKALTGERSLSIDGKVDASTSRDMLTQRLLAHLPLLLHPDPQRVGIVGLGSGVTLASALVHPIGSVDVVEISPEVVEASAHFADENRRALDDPRARLVRGDGRTHLSLTSRRYDVVISEPSNPWMAGVAALFTQEFFQTVRDRLSPGGIFCQWAHTYDISDADLRSIVATFQSVFPEGTMWLAGDGDLLLVGSETPLEPRLDGISMAWQRPGVSEDLRTVGMQDPFALLSLFAGGPGEMSRYGAGAIIQTDDRTALEFSGPLAVFGTTQANHTTTLRALIDDGQRPAAVMRALTGATASQWRNRAGMLMDAQAFDSAYRDYATALALDSTDDATLDGLVRAATAARQEDDAERRLRALIQSRDAEPGPRVALAELLGIRGRFDEALTTATDATRLAPENPAAWEQLASLHTDRGDVVRLAAAVNVLRREFPQRAASWYFAASESFLRGDVAAALPMVRRAIELDANYADAYNLLGAIHGTAGDTSAGRDAFRTSLRLDPRDAITYVNLAQLELAAGERDAAAGLFAEALSLDPNSIPAREGLAQARTGR